MLSVLQMFMKALLLHVIVQDQVVRIRNARKYIRYDTFSKKEPLNLHVTYTLLFIQLYCKQGFNQANLKTS